MLLEDSARNRRVGIGLVTLTTLCFATLDISAKWLVLSLPVLQVVWMRFTIHVVLTSALLAPIYGRELVQVRSPGLQLLRALMLVSMTAMNFWALQYLQLAQTGAIQFSVPLLIALISVWGLGERLDRARWLAIITGFLGVLLVIQPGSQAFHPAIVLSMGNALLYAAFNLLTRRLAATDSPAATRDNTFRLGALGLASGCLDLGLAFFVRSVRWHGPLLRGVGPPLRDSGHARPFPVPTNHLYDPGRLACIWPAA
jgi:drug/metabolite transporter (DMT)-like permease